MSILAPSPNCRKALQLFGVGCFHHGSYQAANINSKIKKRQVTIALIPMISKPARNGHQAATSIFQIRQTPTRNGSVSCRIFQKLFYKKSR